jgi:DNA-binding CsgD family transcriptional regulator
MLLLDGSRRCRQANQAALRLFGLAHTSLIGRRLDELVATPTPEDLQAHWETILAAGQGAGTLMVRGSGVGAVKVRFSATPNIAGGLHLLILISAHHELEVASDSTCARLTGRESEVLALVAEGCSGHDVAERLGIAPETVRRHIANGRCKLGARTRAHAVALGLARGAIRWPSTDATGADCLPGDEGH